MKSSPFYPPRAGPLSRLLVMMDRLRLRMKRSLAHHPVFPWASPLPGGIPWLLLPGLMWCWEGETKLGRRVMLAWAVLVVIHIVSLNIALASAAVTLASVLHAISAAAVLTVLYPHWRGVSRLWRTTLIATLLVLVIYTLGLRNVILPFAQRVTIQGTTVMIHNAGWFSSSPLAPGEWVAYRILGVVSIDRILAGPGDTIRFHPDSFEVNGRFFERVSQHMPTSAEVTMGADTYFIWPTETTSNISEQLLGLTEIKKADILGRPYRRWLWESPALEALKPVPSPTP